MQFDAYLRKLNNNLRRGDATEHTHRAALADLIEGLESGLSATNEPRRSEVGAPDYIVSRGSVSIGYIEAKDVSVDLARAERSEQLKRYRQAFPNLVLTDYLEFRHYVDGERRETGRIAEIDSNGKLRADREGQKEVERLMRSFVNEEAPVVSTPHELASRMAALSREIHDLIAATFKKEGQHGQLHAQLQAFQQTLIPGLSPGYFADMYAQTIAYGLFTARTATDRPQEFTRRTAVWDLPRTNPFLRSLFNEIAGPDLDDRVSWIVDELAELLRRSKVEEILKDFGQRTRQEDPVVHFYETFLFAYNPKERERRGVYYTPEPVVNYIVRSVDLVLKNSFCRASGLADPNTRVLDPATGTSTFLYYVIRHVYESLEGQGQLGTWSAYVRDDLLPRVYGFELLMAPYAVAHMKLSILLSELGYDFSSGERLRVYLTNTLEEGDYAQPTGFTEYIAREANAATEVKNEQPIEVIVGNPPYSGQPANTGDWIVGLIDDYKKVDGEPLGERNPKVINDDYVKFIRFGQWRIDKTGCGVLAFITNHSYLDNPAFRGMRRSLMKSFTDIYLLDLHGNSNRREKTPAGGKDENVFDIRQGVSIAFLIKEPDKQGPACVHHADMWGAREDKYEQLSEQDLQKTKWEKVEPQYPNYLFDPQNAELLYEYEQGWSLDEAMPINSVGIVTHRDAFVFDFDESNLRTRIENFLDSDRSDEYVRNKYLSKSDQLPVSTVRKSIRETAQYESAFIRCLYRPFDERFLFYQEAVIDRSRQSVMKHMLPEENLGLVFMRQASVHGGYSHIGVTENLVNNRAFYSNKGYTTLAPLYLYPTNDNLFDAAEKERRPNLSPEFVQDLSAKLGLEFVADGRGNLAKTVGPEDVFHYAYAIFYAPSYRERYVEFLKRDFPRLPLTSDRDFFARLAEKGEELVGLHLMRSPALDNFITRFPEPGDNVVERVRYETANERVRINESQYFEGVPEEVWEFHIGGYQVLDKWLKDRKDRALTASDIRHYQRIVVALSRTLRIMQEIEEIIPGWPLQSPTNSFS